MCCWCWSLEMMPTCYALCWGVKFYIYILYYILTSPPNVMLHLTFFVMFFIMFYPPPQPKRSLWSTWCPWLDSSLHSTLNLTLNLACMAWYIKLLLCFYSSPPPLHTTPFTLRLSKASNFDTNFFTPTSCVPSQKSFAEGSMMHCVL